MKLDESGFLLADSNQPEGLRCEARDCGGKPAEFVYGPECEATSGNLMYLCRGHAERIRLWMVANPNEPVDCKIHGTIGKVKGYLILKEM